MNCPYCNEEMQKGRIQGDTYALSWIPEGERTLFPRHSIRLGERSIFRLSKIESYYCLECKKLITDLS